MRLSHIVRIALKMHIGMLVEKKKMFCKKYAKICAYRDIKAEIKKDKNLIISLKNRAYQSSPGRMRDGTP